MLVSWFSRVAKIWRAALLELEPTFHSVYNFSSLHTRLSIRITQFLHNNNNNTTTTTTNNNNNNNKNYNYNINNSNNNSYNIIVIIRVVVTVIIL